MAKTCFSIIDIVVTAISLCSFVLDVGTDVTVCVQYFCDGLVGWGWMVLALTVVPAVVMNIFSLAWHVHDKTVTTLTTVCHLVLLAPVHRYVSVLHLGVKSRKSRKVVHSQKAWRAQNDVSILRLFEAFMESSPQLILQLFIIIHHRRIDWFTGLSACASFLSLSWALTAYSDSLRRACKSGYQRRVTGLFLHWGWQLFMALSRISAFVIFAYILETWVFLGMGIHWLCCFVWICVQGTDFGNGPCEKWMFRVVCAFIYVFVFLNLNDGMSRYRVTAFYTVMLLENTAMVVVYFLFGDGDYLVLAGTVVFGGFVLGLVCMCIYYSFLHPTKPLLKPWLSRLRQSKPDRLKSVAHDRSSATSSTTQGPVPIFSIESPRSVPVMDGTSVNLSLPNSLHNLTNTTSQSCRSPGSAFTVPLQVHETLKHKWQSGMDSSSCSSSSSSLASDPMETKKIERPSSRTSEHSNDSERSNNCLLVSESKNNLNKNLSPKRKHKSLQFVDKISNDDPSFNADKNVYGSESPSLSRCSWARSSDDTRLSLGMEEFVTLGFDCSSSIERRVSETSSFNARPKSLSPLNVTNLWQDARSKLRQTIAATIAAATCNPSSNEGTPNNSQSFVSQATSSQDESVSSLSHNFGFMDSKSSYNERDRDRLSSVGSGSLHSGKFREGLSSLPDICEAAEHEQLSDISCEVSARRSPHQPNSNPASPWFNPGTFVTHSGSPFTEDSTLTASKLGHKAVTPVSYLSAQNRTQPFQDSSNSLHSRESENSTPLRKESSSKKLYNPDGSPFTDQELTSVMAKSLQSYSGASSSADSTNKEREGLALTLEDLEYPGDLEVDGLEEQAATSFDYKDCLTKSRSTSSLFHDADDSSPASTASKMQRVADLKRPDSEISPNAFKHLDVSPSYLMHQSTKSSVLDSKIIKELQTTLANPNNSEALKILIEAYGQLSTRSPQVQQTPDCTRLSVHKNDPETYSPGVPLNSSNHFPNQPSMVKRLNPEFQLFRESDSDYGETRKVLPGKNIELFDSIAWQKAKLLAKQRAQENALAYAGRSSTKKLNVHGNKHVLELHNSPRLQSSVQFSPEANEAVDYVAGKYCPPLCKSSFEMEEQSILNNLNLSQRNSYKSHSPKKEIPTNPISSGLTPSRHSASSLHPKPFSLQDNNLRRSFRHQQESDFFHLHPQDHRQKSTRPLQDSLETRMDVDWDINEARLIADSPLSYSRHQRSLHNSGSSGLLRETFAHSPQVSSFSDQDLKMSAKQVENYFSNALNLNRVPMDKTHSHTPRSEFDAHSSLRQPLKSLQNSPQHIPHASRHHTRQSQQYGNRNDEFDGGGERRRRNLSDERQRRNLSGDRKSSGASRRLSRDGRFI